jgi:ribosomal protein S18 acetylase RimI-like enzyme
MPADTRTARASDVDDLAAIENAVFEGDRITRKSFRRLIRRETAAVLVAERGKALAGYCVVLFRSDSAAARLYSIAAAPGAAGIGRPLLTAAEQAAAAHGRDRLRLEVRDDNLRAIDLYERSGYRRTGEIAGYYADGVTALRYEKQLAAPTGQGTHPDKMGNAA